MKANRKKKLKIFLIIIATCLISVSIAGHKFYSKIYSPNVAVGKNKYLFIPTGADYLQVTDSLTANNFIIDKESFDWVAQKKKYPQLIKPGRYELKDGMSNNELINMLRIGNQKHIDLTFNNVRTIEQLAGKISSQIEADSVSLVSMLKDKNFIQETGFDKYNILSMFLPDTYKFKWNTSSQEFLTLMQKEYDKFWNEQRLSQAEKIGLSKIEVSVLASIVQAEQAIHNEEKKIIAGLYINRLNLGMPLESDPTLVFASGDFEKKRVLNSDKEIDSPYNTYKNTGLPPGPINLPEKTSINAVLEYQKNDYIFMCAKEDFSGFHNFSKNLEQHNHYARLYQNALNNRKIYK